MSSSKKQRVEFGDFQTPAWFAQEVCAFLWAKGVAPASVLEPTCGLGHFLLAAVDTFASARTAVGVEINRPYVDSVSRKLSSRTKGPATRIIHADFFALDWAELLQQLPAPLLIIGNPPWVTNSELAVLGGDNLPPKNNFQNQAGIQAITGSSNFDISEWMLLQMIGWVTGREGVVAVLVKTAVARKLLHHIWQQYPTPGSPSMHLIDAQAIFGVSVDACLFVYDSARPDTARACPVYEELARPFPITEIGYRQDQLVANAQFFDRWQHLARRKQGPYRWRSGIKHDCAPVMELQKVNNAYVNKLGEHYPLEATHLYPMLKSSDIAGSKECGPKRWMLVPQKEVGENTRAIQTTAPQTWAYLQDHAELLDNRKSAIYRHRPRFSIFGVGDYSFTPWKVAISGLYKQLEFVVIGPHHDKPVVLDDTCYFLPCFSQKEANLLAQLLNSEPAQQFYQSLIFWDAKRPITAKILGRLDLLALAAELGLRQKLIGCLQSKSPESLHQLPLFTAD